MNVDEVKEREAKPNEARASEGLQGLIELARRAVPDRRRDTETLEPVDGRRALALFRQVRERIDWKRLPGLSPQPARPAEKMQVVLAKRFAIFVLLPTAIIAAYLYLIAADEYIARTQFAVRGNVEPMEQAPLNSYADLIQKHNSQDSYIVRDFIQSRAMSDAAESTLKISKIFSREEADFWSRYNDPQPAEKLARYWRKHVAVHIEQVSGVITLDVRAFTPEDAVAISELVIARSERLVNDMSRRAQADMVENAEKDARMAEERLKRARLAMQSFRNKWGIIDPVKSAETIMTTMMMLKKDKLKAENDLQVLRDSRLDEKTRGIQVLVATVAATDAQIKRLQDQLTNEGLSAGASNNLTQALLEFEGLQVEQLISEKINESLHLLLDKARLAASRQQIYLATFVPPVLPTTSLYPNRPYALLITFFCAFVLWSASSLLISGIKDQRI